MAGLTAKQAEILLNYLHDSGFEDFGDYFDDPSEVDELIETLTEIQETEE